VQAHDIGAFAYITKPFDPIALGALIASTLEPSRAEPSRAEAVWA
jgi:DNA-binding response OmpR family regulator